MSNDAMAWAWKSDLAPGPKFVLVALADHGSDHSGEDWSCFPSIAKLVQRTGCSRPTVERHLKALEADGWIERARRRRADGSFGIYDYTLKRERAEAGPAGVVAARRKAANALAEQGVGADEPYVNLMHGGDGDPCVNLEPAMHQIDDPPCVNLMGQEEPSRVNPQENPQTARAREPGDLGFDDGLAAYPDSGQRRTDEPAARAAWAMACEAIGSERLIGAVRRYAAEDPDLKTGDFGAPAFERWLSGRRWRPWLAGPAIVGEARVGDAPTPAVQAFAGPAELLGAFAAIADAGKVNSYLIPCRYEPGPPARLLARTETAAQWLRRQRDVVRQFELVVEVGAQAASRQASDSAENTGRAS